MALKLGANVIYTFQSSIAEIKHSDWMFQVMRRHLTNQSDLF